MFSRFVLALSLLLTVTSMLPHRAQAADLVVTSQVATNPTIRFNGVTGAPPPLSQAVGSFLKGCGWFDVVRDGKSDYVMDARYAGGNMQFQITMNGAPIGSWTVSAVNPRTAAKIAVDTILERLFKVKGLCTTRIAFCADTGRGVKNIYVCDIDGGDVRQVTNFNSLCVEPCWFPDGRAIGYTKYGRSVTDVVETRLEPAKMSRRLSSFPGLNVGVSISPDSSKMALILSPDHMVDLYVKPVTYGKPLRLTRGRSVEASPCWSPDSRKICFVSDESGSPRLYSVNADGSGRQLLPSVGNEAVTPDWSQDGKIVYATRVDGVYTLAVLDLEKRQNTRATMVPGSWESPAWAPDNRQVVCKRSDGRRASLFVVDTWTGKVRQLLSTSNPLSMPAWSKARK